MLIGAAFYLAQVFMERFKELDNHVQLMTQIKRGEEKIKKREEIQKYLDLKMEKYIKPFQHLRIQCVLAQFSSIRPYFKRDSDDKTLSRFEWSPVWVVTKVDSLRIWIFLESHNSSHPGTNQQTPN
jgi:hypothetical protein